MSKFSTILAALGSAALGAFISFVILQKGDQEHLQSKQNIQTKEIKNQTTDSSFTNYFDRNFSYVKNIETFEDKLKTIHQSSRSPIRAHITTESYLENGSFELWHDKIKNAEITGNDLLRMVAAYLVRQDTARAVDLLLNSEYAFQSFEDLLTFGAALSQEAARVNPDAAIIELHEKEPNLHRQVIVGWFSDQLARDKPELAAERYSELIKLRDRETENESTFTHSLIQSWASKDSQALNSFILQLPAGEQRELFENILTEIQKPEVSN